MPILLDDQICPQAITYITQQNEQLQKLILSLDKQKQENDRILTSTQTENWNEALLRQEASDTITDAYKVITALVDTINKTAPQK